MDEQVEAIYEYGKNKMILSIYPFDLLIVNDWEVV